MRLIIEADRTPRRHAPKGPVKAKVHPMDTSHPMERVTCTATNRQGKRCGKPPIPGGAVCRMHGGAAPQVQFAALERLKALQPKALLVVERLLERDEFPTVQLGAYKDVMDRTEGKAMERVEQHVDGAITLQWQS